MTKSEYVSATLSGLYHQISVVNNIARADKDFRAEEIQELMQKIQWLSMKKEDHQ